MAAPNTGAASTQQQLLQGLAPTTGADNIAIAALQSQQQAITPQVAQETAYANALSGIQSSQYNIQQQQTGLQQLGNTQQAAQNTAQQGIEQTGYGLQQAAYGIQGSELTNQQASLNLNYGNALRSQSDTGAGQGTLNTQGQARANSTLGTQQVLATGALGLQSQLLGNQQAQSQNTQAGEESGYQFNQSQLANAQQNLGLIAQANGLSNQQALTMLNYQNQQAGVQGQQQSTALLAQIGEARLGDLSNVGSALSTQSFAQG
jgi:hypothetical protein